MKVLCVQCSKLNDLQDSTQPAADGKVRFPCPHCGFVTVVTRKPARASKPQPVPTSPPPPVATDLNRGRRGQADTTTGGASNRRTPDDPDQTQDRPRRPAKSLHDELFDGSEKNVGDWMVRRLDGTEAGPLVFEDLKEMIQDGDIGKIDEVRRLDERYVPAAFHEMTAELFNELDMAGVGTNPRKG